MSSPVEAGARRHDLVRPVRDDVPHTWAPWPFRSRPSRSQAERAAAGPLGGARRDGRPRRRRRDLLGGRMGRLHRGLRNTDCAPLQPQMTLAAAPDTMMGAIPARSRASKTRSIEPSGPAKELIPREGHGDSQRYPMSFGRAAVVTRQRSACCPLRTGIIMNSGTTILPAAGDGGGQAGVRKTRYVLTLYPGLSDSAINGSRQADQSGGPS